jgi:putative membrane protein insertion efficiency factor
MAGLNWMVPVAGYWKFRVAKGFNLRILNSGLAGMLLLYLILMVPQQGLAGEKSLDFQERKTASSPVTAPIQMYQRFFSGANGHRCPMTPSCSHYSMQAFGKHGFLMGWILSSDRLLRCGRDETRLSETRRINGRVYSYDPLENNDFWWTKRQKTKEK